MALTKQDKIDIGEIVEEKITREVGISRVEMNGRFDMTDKRISEVEITLSKKIDEIKQMETEDI